MKRYSGGTKREKIQFHQRQSKGARREDAKGNGVIFAIVLALLGWVAFVVVMW